MIKASTDASVFRRVLLEHEADIGSKLFSATQNTITQEFYYAGNNFWIWNNKNSRGNSLIETTIYYKIVNNRILKSNDGVGYILVGKSETSNLLKAVRAYRKKVVSQVYAPLKRSL